MKRRSFLEKFGSIFPLIYLPKLSHGANNSLQIASIGVGGKGGSDLQQIARHGELVAACDISDKKLDYALTKFPKAAKFSDYREMISHLGNQIDVLSISTPDHTHAHAAQLAINRGIHLFIQPPLAHSVLEVRQLKKDINKSKLCSQIGLQGWASDQFRLGVEYLNGGGLGQVKEVHVWTNRPVWPQSPEVIKPPSEANDIPDGLNWDAFIGPAAQTPYHRSYQPYNWRGWRKFGSGALGDVGGHLLNLPVAGCKLSNPQKVSCILTGPVNLETYSAWGIVKFEFIEQKTDRPISLFWYEGRIGHLSKKSTGKVNIPPADLFLGHAISPNGCLICGTNGTMYSPSIYGLNWKVHLGKKWLLPSEIDNPPPKFPRNGRGDTGMKEELIYAIREANPNLALSNLNYASELCEITTLGNVSLLAGGQFKWDSVTYSSDRTDVNSLLTKPYRQGWELRSI